MARRYSVHAGDILLFKSRGDNTSFLDKLISFGQRLFKMEQRKSIYCHVAIVDGDTRYILESKWPKPMRTSLAKRKMSKNESIEVYRIRNITPEQVKQILKWAHEHLGEWYNLSLFFTGFLNIKHLELCSIFVNLACQSANLVVPTGCANTKFIMPDDYYNDKLMLERIM